MASSSSTRNSPKKRRVGDADALSGTSASLDVNAFILNSPSVSDEPGGVSRVRPGSPTRDLRETYKYARPPLRFSQSIKENSPRMAHEVFSVLPIAKTYACEVIPINFKERITSDHSFPNPPSYAYDKNQSCESEKEQWARMTRLLSNARNSFENNKNEKAWVVVACDMLNAALSLRGSGSKDMVAVEHVSVFSLPPIRTVILMRTNLSGNVPQNSQDPSLTPDTLPTVNGQRVPCKKVDLVLALSPNNPTVFATYDKLRTADPLVRISQFVDASLSRMTIPVYVEVGEAGKDYLEASLQLGIVGSAGLARLGQLRRTLAPASQEGEMMLPPVLGWTVIGHDWKLHIICKLPENEHGAVVGRTAYYAIILIP
ncbi:hypothetical protein GP486_003240 [Trichoglossum hirsutum]|uniref:PD-(D/E)XK nuclease-like domain-containing protein n=1 Tax=Trichoglossum hirsutum TaxID=265104 RepID=A0A9P8LDF4_9PEZI|nr:hypothetical protein GP486_003240 [Trichoglossum hirsutum]